MTICERQRAGNGDATSRSPIVSITSRSRRFASLAVASAGALLYDQPARAQSLASFLQGANNADFVNLALSGGLALFSAVVALAHLAERKAWSRREARLAGELEFARAKLDRAEIFLASEPQLLVSWDGATSEPDIENSLVGDGPSARRMLAFGSWLAPKDARELEEKIDRLRLHGESFRMALPSSAGRRFDAEGRAVAGRAVLRIREVSGDRLELLGLRERHARSVADVEGLHAMLEALPTPAWIRDAQGRLSFVNSAYAQAVEAKSPDEAVRQQVELLDHQARAEAQAARAEDAVWRERVTAVVAGERRRLDVVDAPWNGASAALAMDRSEIDKARSDFEQQMEAHSRTLDQLPIAVAIFDRAKRLVYRNAAYSRLWPLDSAFLDQGPSDGEILDRLRAEQRLPVEADYKAWKTRLLEAYRSSEHHEHVWHMPNGRTLRVVVNPNPQGGVTYLYDDVSERYNLESRFNALDRMQNETLENLREGVAVFGADGRLRFCNPAFAALWRLDKHVLDEKPRFDVLAKLCRRLHPDDDTWSDLRGFVTGLQEARTGFTRRIERSDGVVLDCTAQPLPEGAALLTFVDVTAGVNVERALTERNQALLAAEKIRNDFVHHVSYELRSPLNNIIGFIHLLGEKSTGELNAKQVEYLGYVGKSSAALLAIINDILDLATIDSDAMELELEEVDAQDAMRAAAEGVQDRLAESAIELQIVTTGDVGSFRGDAKRIRQILFNLLSNAIGFSRPGQTITLMALRREDEIVFKVTDRGRGIAPDALERVFDRFESHTTGSRHRGVGLGLSIVRAFTELHGGSVLIDSALGEGTTVTCVFPARENRGEAGAAQEKGRAS
ncbi:MAG: two-component sensor histidine kinase [Methylocystaceae bacterium]|nr:MAG: two-component sensor histidine kinase [Methylocystaceae bacterium]